MTIAKFQDYSGLSHSYIYDLKKQGKLEFAKVGRRSLVVLDSFERLIAPKVEEPKQPQPDKVQHLRRASDPV